MLGAAGARGVHRLRARRCAIRIVPPTINYCNPDPECDLDYTPNRRSAARGARGAEQQLRFGGHNVALAVKRFTE